MARPRIDFDWLLSTHQEKRLQLSTTRGLSGCVHLNDDPQAFVSELIRLARIGSKVEVAAAASLAARPDTIDLRPDTLNRAHVAWMLAMAKMPSSVSVKMTTDQAKEALRAAITAAVGSIGAEL